MNILVTGGAGFIGSRLAERLAKDGHEVTVLDNFNDYYNPKLKRDRVEQFLQNVSVVEGDIRDEKLLETLFVQKKFAAVCHLAAMAGVRYSVENPAVYADVNIQGLITLLEVMRKNECTQMVFASSSSVYGNSTNPPYQEDTVADRPESVYGATKRAGELILHSYHALYGLNTTALRFFTVYGPWSRPDMAMLKFAQMMQQGKPIPVYNEGKLRRDFTHVDDIVNGFVLAVEKPQGHMVLNLGRGEPVELLRYISLLETSLGISAEKELLPMQQGDVLETYADISQARQLLGYQPKVSIEEGVKTFADWFKSYY